MRREEEEDIVEDVVVHIESDSESSLDQEVGSSPTKPSSSHGGSGKDAAFFMKKEVNIEDRLDHSHERKTLHSSISPSDPMFLLRHHLDLQGVPKSVPNMIAILEEISKEPIKYPVVNFLEKIQNLSPELFQNVWCSAGLTLIRAVLVHSIDKSQEEDALKVLSLIEKLVPGDRSFLNASGLPSYLVQLADSDVPSIRRSAENVVNAWSRRPTTSRMASKRAITSDAEREKARELLRRQLGSIEKRERTDDAGESDDRVARKMKSSLDGDKPKKKQVRWAAQLEHVRTFERDESLKPRRMSKRGEHLEEKLQLQKLREEEDIKRSRLSDMLSQIPWKRPPIVDNNTEKQWERVTDATMEMDDRRRTKHAYVVFDGSDKLQTPMEDYDTPEEYENMGIVAPSKLVEDSGERVVASTESSVPTGVSVATTSQTTAPQPPSLPFSSSSLPSATSTTIPAATAASTTTGAFSQFLSDMRTPGISYGSAPQTMPYPMSSPPSHQPPTSLDPSVLLGLIDQLKRAPSTSSSLQTVSEPLHPSFAPPYSYQQQPLSSFSSSMPSIPPPSMPMSGSSPYATHSSAPHPTSVYHHGMSVVNTSPVFQQFLQTPPSSSFHTAPRPGPAPPAPLSYYSMPQESSSGPNPYARSPSSPPSYGRVGREKDPGGEGAHHEHRNFKTQHCRFYRQGRCKKGDACPFIHDDDSIGSGAVRSRPSAVIHGIPKR